MSMCVNVCVRIAAVVCCLFAYLPALGEKCVGIRGCVCFRGH